MISSTTPPYQALSPNLVGRDWFIGDIHGCFETLMSLLKKKGFNEENDRLISVGDLVDRGNESEKALEWLKKSFFYAVRGNHEDLYLYWRSLKNNRAAQIEFENEIYFRKVNGGEWVKEINETLHLQLEEALGKLPYFLAVPHQQGQTIGVVHAELPDGVNWPSLINIPMDSELKKSMTWGRKRWKSKKGRGEAAHDNNRILGLDALVCGHVITRDPIGIGNIVYIDTGGWNKGSFTILPFEEILDLVE